MLDVLNASAEGFFLLFHWKTFLFMMFGISLGMIFGLIPGLSGLTGMSLLLPIAITQPPEIAVAFLLGMYAVTTQTDAIPAVLIGAPGTSAAQATYLDGYPMAQRGEAGRALSASYFAGVRGMLVSFVVVILFLPVLRSIIDSVVIARWRRQGAQLASVESFQDQGDPSWRLSGERPCVRPPGGSASRCRGSRRSRSLRRRRCTRRSG